MGQKEIDCESTLSDLTTLLTTMKEGVKAGGCSVLSATWSHVPTPVPIYISIKWDNFYCHYFK